MLQIEGDKGGGGSGGRRAKASSEDDEGGEQAGMNRYFGTSHIPGTELARQVVPPPICR